MIECVITCVNYGDFLAYTLPFNRSLFDRIVVVTSPEDKLTQRVCEYWYVECIQTTAFGTQDGKFIKGSGINEGLSRLSKTGWLVHMDADILLPPLTKRLMDVMNLDKSFIYGCDRFNCQSFEDWARFMSTPRLQHENNSWIHTSSFQIGTRVAIMEFGGYIPIGFFQMWHADSKQLSYPAGHKGAARDDMDFAARWPRSKRGFIPEIIAYHLESEKADMGANWSGRKTKVFSADRSEPINPPEVVKDWRYYWRRVINLLRRALVSLQRVFSAPSSY